MSESGDGGKVGGLGSGAKADGDGAPVDDKAVGNRAEGKPAGAEPGRTFAPLARRVGLPGYEIQQQLGDGGQALVFFGRQIATGRRVAVKVLRDTRGTRVAHRDRLLREAEILARLDHPYLAKILDRGETPDGQLFLVMNFIAGQPIDLALGSPVEDGVALRRTLEAFLKVLSGVAAMHEAGVVHRDLKPANILLDRSGEPRIIDFGLASGEDRLPSTPSRRRGLVGSLPWASPEQARGLHDQLDARSDLYSLGVVLYQMLTGVFPYDVDCAWEQALANIVEAPAEPLSAPPRWWEVWRWFQGKKRFDPQLQAIVSRALEKERGDRYQSANEMAAAIETYLRG